jgi:hypothetical protein
LQRQETLLKLLRSRHGLPVARSGMTGLTEIRYQPVAIHQAADEEIHPISSPLHDEPVVAPAKAGHAPAMNPPTEPPARPNR